MQLIWDFVSIDLVLIPVVFKTVIELEEETKISSLVRAMEVKLKNTGLNRVQKVESLTFAIFVEPSEYNRAV